MSYSLQTRRPKFPPEQDAHHGRRGGILPDGGERHDGFQRHEQRGTPSQSQDSLGLQR